MNLFSVFVLTLREILKFYSVYTSEKKEMIIEKLKQERNMQKLNVIISNFKRNVFCEMHSHDTSVMFF